MPEQNDSINPMYTAMYQASANGLIVSISYQEATGMKEHNIRAAYLKSLRLSKATSEILLYYWDLDAGWLRSCYLELIDNLNLTEQKASEPGAIREPYLWQQITPQGELLTQYIPYSR